MHPILATSVAFSICTYASIARLAEMHAISIYAHIDRF